jgi:hypothetical protein
MAQDRSAAPWMLKQVQHDGVCCTLPKRQPIAFASKLILQPFWKL